MDKIVYDYNINVYAISALGMTWVGVFIMSFCCMCFAFTCSKMDGKFNFRTCTKKDVGKEFTDYIKGYWLTFNWYIHLFYMLENVNSIDWTVMRQAEALATNTISSFKATINSF